MAPETDATSSAVARDGAASLADAAAGPHTCTSDPQQPCEPCTAAYLRVKQSLETDPSDSTEDSEVVFDMVERLVARGYRVTVSIEMPSGNSMTLTGEPNDI